MANRITLKEKESGRRLANWQKMVKHPDIKVFIKEVLAPLLAARVLKELKGKQEEEVKDSR